MEMEGTRMFADIREYSAAPQTWVSVSLKWAGVAAGGGDGEGCSAACARVCEHMYTCIPVFVSACVCVYPLMSVCECIGMCVCVFMSAHAYLCFCLCLTDSGM